MKSLTSLILIFFINFSVLGAFADRPAVWGKIYKVNQKKYGYSYFIYFKKDGKDFVFPLSSESKISEKKLEKLHGKYARIYGYEQFEEINLERSKHILTFKVVNAKELNLSDLNQDIDLYKDRLNVPEIYQRQMTSDIYEKKGLSNKAINTAIFIGGTILAADILSILLTN